MNNLKLYVEYVFCAENNYIYIKDIFIKNYSEEIHKKLNNGLIEIKDLKKDSNYISLKVDYFKDIDKFIFKLDTKEKSIIIKKGIVYSEKSFSYFKKNIQMIEKLIEVANCILNSEKVLY